MKIVMLCGSPRTKNCNSLYLLECLKEKLGTGHEIKLCEASKGKTPDTASTLAAELADADAFVAAFPLYVDCIPSNLLGILESLECLLTEGKYPTEEKKIKAYAIVNCGFYDAIQTRHSIRMFWKWCEKCGMEKGRALGAGAGEMSKFSPMGKGPATNLGKSLDTLAADILGGKSGDEIFTEPNFPRFLYMKAAHMGWRAAARQNHVKISDVKKRV